jgi:hypothetical protein
MQLKPVRWFTSPHRFHPRASALLNTLLLVTCPAALMAAQLLVAPTGNAVNEGLSGASPAGDFNHDGWNDFIVGSYNEAGTSGLCHAYIFFGGPNMDAVPDVVLSEGPASDNFGITVVGLGDFNGDGIDDVAVGARLAVTAGPHAGKVYVYFGSESTDAIADLQILGLAASENFGGALASAGDVNNDGHPDLIVGATGEGVSDGKAYVYFGGPGADGVADLVLSSPEAGAVFGHAVAGVGDLNGDGFDDMVVGAPYKMPAGATYVFLGGSPPDAVADAVLNGYGPPQGYSDGDQFGRQLAGLGDMNGDGAPDFIVGALNSDAGGEHSGQAYVFFGPLAGLTARFPLRLNAEAPGDLFGVMVAGVGDMNGDCFGDAVVGAIYNDSGGADAGRAYVYFGGPIPDNTPDVILTGEAAGDWFGGTGASGGDLNGDGGDELIVAAQRHDTRFQNAGRAYVYSIPRALALPFVEEWDSGILPTVWKPWGDPLPFVRTGLCTSHALDPNGDGSDQSGVASLATVDMLDRPILTVRAAILRRGEIAGPAWQNVGFGFATVDACAFGVSPRPTVLAEIGLNPGSDVNQLRCEILGGTIYAEPWNPANNGVCREYTIAFDETGHALFYRDGQLLATSPTALDLSDYRAVAVNIDGRSIGTEMRVERVAVELPGFRIASVRDVDHDQGGVVRVRFWNHPGDIAGTASITEYAIWRRLPVAPKLSAGEHSPAVSIEDGIGLLSPQAAAAAGFPDGWWEGLGSIPAVQRSAYSMVVPTLGDSTDAGMVLTTYVVSAHTGDPGLYYVTEPMSGYSVDNLRPDPPSDASGRVAYTGSDGKATVQLSWSRSPSHDVRGYRVCRGQICEEVAGSPYEAPYESKPGEPPAIYTIAAVDFSGNVSYPATPVSVVTSAPPAAVAITRVSLGQARPNPFNPATVIPFALPIAARVELDIYNVAGRLVRRLAEGAYPAGTHEVIFNGKDDTGRTLASGAYTYVLRTGSEQLRGGMLLVK